MVESSNISLIHRWIDEAWNQRNDQSVRELLDPQAIGHLEGLSAKGIDGFLTTRGYLTSAFPDFHLTIEDAIAEGTKLAIRWRATGTHSGAFMGIPATGQEVAFRGMTWFTIVGGRIVEGWDSWNQGRILAQLTDADRKK
jgi:steroid delta-isomerase-like uncharacterized protein